MRSSWLQSVRTRSTSENIFRIKHFAHSRVANWHFPARETSPATKPFLRRFASHIEWLTRGLTPQPYLRTHDGVMVMTLDESSVKYTLDTTLISLLIKYKCLQEVFHFSLIHCGTDTKRTQGVAKTVG